MTHERWFTVWMLLAGLAVVAITVLTIMALEDLQDIQAQLDHIDTHFQAPEPTPQQNGVTG